MIVYGSCVGSVVVQLGVASCGVIQHWFSSCVFSCGSGWYELSVRSSAMVQLSNIWLHIDRI